MKQRTFIHFIGKKYYTISQFIKEAMQSGISRAVAPAVFKKMKIGDLILLAQKEGSSTKIFGGFYFTKIIGLNEKLIEKLSKEGDIKYDSASTLMKVERGCGSYVVEGTYHIANKDSVMESIQDQPTKEIGKVLIGGSFHALSQFGIPENYILCKLPFQMGFRRMDFEEMFRQYKELKPQAKKNVKVKGQFYIDEDSQNESVHVVKYPILLQIKDYKLN